MTRKRRRDPTPSFLHEHSLSLTLAAMLVALLMLYARAEPHTHLGTLYGNAIADWLAVLVFVITTKYFVEAGSGESRQPRREFHARVARFLQVHSLTIVLSLTGAGWIAAYARSDVDSRGGQVIGNIVSAWIQVLGLVVITKYARERGSKEGN